MPCEYHEIAELLEELLRQSKHLFPQMRHLPNAPENQGVYIIRKNGIVLHVGRNLRARGGLRQRLADHLRGGSSFVRDYLNGQPARLREEGYTYQFLEVECPRKRALLEAPATGTPCPAHVGTGDRQAHSNQGC